MPPRCRVPAQNVLALSITFVTSLFATAANAHVKWFCAYDVAGRPEGLASVLCQDFELLVTTSVLFLVGGCLVEGTPIGIYMQRALNRATKEIAANIEMLVRSVCAFFFVALWAMGGVLLTPELTTTNPYMSWLQLAMAVSLLWRQTSPFAAVGIVFLYADAASQYGVFHLADYPVFIGVAAYLALTGMQKQPFGIRPLDIMRWAAGITLMWASIEKWAYPEWSYPLFIEHPRLSMGFDQTFYMRAAGVVEFALAFSLLWTPLVRRIGAIMLAGMFVAACFEFGKIDVIGHSPIVIVLLAVISDQGESEYSWKRTALAPAAYLFALFLSLAIYYGAHALIYPATALS